MCCDVMCYTTLHDTTLHSNVHIHVCTLRHVQLMESFGAGTAAVICPVKGIIYQGQVQCLELFSSCLLP